jgi:hypothetical protein
MKNKWTRTTSETFLLNNSMLRTATKNFVGKSYIVITIQKRIAFKKTKMWPKLLVMDS